MLNSVSPKKAANENRAFDSIGGGIQHSTFNIQRATAQQIFGGVSCDTLV